MFNTYLNTYDRKSMSAFVRSVFGIGMPCVREIKWDTSVFVRMAVVAVVVRGLETVKIFFKNGVVNHVVRELDTVAMKR